MSLPPVSGGSSHMLTCGAPHFELVVSGIMSFRAAGRKNVGALVTGRTPSSERVMRVPASHLPTVGVQYTTLRL